MGEGLLESGLTGDVLLTMCSISEASRVASLIAIATPCTYAIVLTVKQTLQ